MADAAHLATDKKLERIDKKLTSIHKRAEKEIGVKWRDYLIDANAQIAPLQKQLADAQAKHDTALANQLKKQIADKQRAMTVVNSKYKRLTDQLANEITKVNQTAVAYVNGETPSIFTLNYNYVAQDINSFDLGISFELVDKNTVKKLILEEPELLPSQTINNAKDIAWNIHKTNSEVLQGILQGESIEKLAARLAKSVCDSNEAAAIRNARTMTTGAENAGRRAGHERAAKMGVHLEDVWIATLDGRTRHEHRLADQQSVKVGQPFILDGYKLRFPGDPSAPGYLVYNCRCTVIGKLIGIDDDIDEIRHNSDLKGMTYEQWKASKPVYTHKKKRRKNGTSKNNK